MSFGLDTFVAAGIGLLVGLLPTLESRLTFGKKFGVLVQKVDALESGDRQTVIECGKIRAGCVMAMQAELAAGSKEFANVHDDISDIKKMLEKQASDYARQYDVLLSHLLSQKSGGR